MDIKHLRTIVWKNSTIIIVIILTLFGIQEHTAKQYAPQIGEVLESIKPDDTSTVSTHTVMKVYDGDTVTLQNGDRVRLIGINAPEIGSKHATSSRDFLSSLVLDREVRIEGDKTPRDQYNRILAYMYVDDIFINERMVEVGLARSYPYKPDIKHQDLFDAAENKARSLKLGIWE